jgi:hypothetical protein
VADLLRVDAHQLPRVLPLLRLFPDGARVAAQWERFAVHHWPFEEGYFGYALQEGGALVGFLGLVFHTRQIQGRSVKICSPSSWIVRPEFRSESLALLAPLAELRDYTIVNMSPSAAVLPIFRLLKFRDLETSIRSFLPGPRLAFLSAGRDVIFDLERIASLIGPEDRRILDHHGGLGCHHIALTHRGGCCYLVATRRRKRRLIVAHIHYLSDIELFGALISGAVPQICAYLRVAGVQIDQRLLQGQDLSWSIRGRLSQPRVYRSMDLSPEQIDGLYTEMVFLNK